MKILTVALLVFDAAILGYVLQQIISWAFLWERKTRGPGPAPLVAAPNSARANDSPPRMDPHFLRRAASS